MQLHTSAGTSVNVRHLPKLYTKLAELGVLANGTGIDFGSGKYTKHLADFTHAQGGTMMFYDPYNQPASVNAATLLHRNRSTYCLCSNVLNVIDSDDGVRDAIRTAVSLGNGTAYFSVYEGNGTGIGIESKTDCWQRNQKLREYRGFCDKEHDVTFRNGVMIVKRKEK